MTLAAGEKKVVPDREEESALAETFVNFRRFGINTEPELRAALLAQWHDGPTISRSHAWMTSWLYDLPTELDIFSAMAKQDPEDLEAVIQSARSAYALGRMQQALDILALTEGKNPVNRDERGGAHTLDDLERQWCVALRDSGRPADALPHCLKVKRDGYSLAEVAITQLALGHYAEAVGPAHDAAQLFGTESNLSAQAGFYEAVALFGLGKKSDAKAKWAEVLEGWPSHIPADRALRGVDVDVDGFLNAEAAFKRRGTAVKLAKCGHRYLDLQMPDRATRCFQEADRIEPGHEAQERIAHLTETNPAAALAEAETALAANRNIPLLMVTGWLNHRQGNQKQARALLEEVLKLEPRNYEANRKLAGVCLDIGDTDCADAHFALSDRPKPADALMASLKFVGLLVPVAIIYVVVRRRVVARLKKAKA